MWDRLTTAKAIAPVRTVRYERLLDGARRHALDQLFREEGVDDDDRYHGDHHAGGDHPDVLEVVAHVAADADGQRGRLGVVHQHHGEQELVPQLDEVQDDGGGNGRHAHWQHDAEEDAEVRITVDLGGVEQVLRDSCEEAFEQVHRQRQLQADVDQGQTDERVVQVVVDQHLEQRDQDDLRRKDDAAEQHEVHRPVAAEVIARQAVRGGSTEQRDDGHGRALLGAL